MLPAPTATDVLPTPCRGRTGQEDSANSKNRYEIRSCSENMQAYKNNAPRGSEASDGKEHRQRSCGESDAGISNADLADPRSSIGSCSSNSSDRSARDKSELEQVLTRRRQVVDARGNHYESPSPRKRSSTRQQRGTARELFHEVSDSKEQQEDESPLIMTPERVVDEPSRPPARKRRTSREDAMKSVVKGLEHMTDEQLAAMRSVLNLMAGKPADAQEPSTPSSDSTEKTDLSDRGSSHSQGSTRATSAPPCVEVRYYDTQPVYPDLRKKRLSGQRSTTPLKVRFSEEEGGAVSSDDDTMMPITTQDNMTLRSRRLSRGPDGSIYRVKSENEEPARAPSVSSETSDAQSKLDLDNVVATAAGAARGAAVGGACGFGVGVAGALFTFGLSIPICTVAGAAYKGYKEAAQTYSGHEATPERSTSEPPAQRSR